MATSLDLPHLSMYTGLCLRRSSATLLADLEADITTIKRHESWKSIAVAEGYIQDSVQKTANQARIAEQTSFPSLPFSCAVPSYTFFDRGGLVEIARSGGVRDARKLAAFRRGVRVAAKNCWSRRIRQIRGSRRIRFDLRLPGTGLESVLQSCYLAGTDNIS
ncbi:hypothetical protein GEV33_005219 [Tenebrio molitor]|uniref:Uncharacterized protein n=1 Tax=Tenebrio molitor TaxID=7067 RepID=A0A8J6HNN8_TENMO|nr:hypothetical protein GEV33_005219 [Tenebrio molitor]